MFLGLVTFNISLERFLLNILLNVFIKDCQDSLVRPGMENDVLDRLIKECQEAKKKAYAPYSKFRVGAAVLCEDGKIFQGCNVENAAYGQGLCAERAAIVTAVSKGYRRFKAIAITTDIIDRIAWPCGACRQFIIEFGRDYDLYLVKLDSTYTKINVKELLPLAFEPIKVTKLNID